jgi:hypothetical protein
LHPCFEILHHQRGFRFGRLSINGGHFSSASLGARSHLPISRMAAFVVRNLPAISTTPSCPLRCAVRSECTVSGPMGQKARQLRRNSSTLVHPTGTDEGDRQHDAEQDVVSIQTGFLRRPCFYLLRACTLLLRYVCDKSHGDKHQSLGVGLIVVG